jgi:phospholipid/cholesterol/gamma-HCH transport system substrate-binding protein
MHEGEGTVARLIRDPTLYERIDKFVVDSQSLMTDIQENPRKYINLKVF